MADSTDIQNAIIAAATKAGVDPAWALAVAERESNFNPDAKASKTIHGVFQMTKGLRDQYGIGDSTDAAAQSAGFMDYANKELKQDMAKVLGREPTPQEMYAGHHFGPVRAARLIASGHPDTPVSEVFTRQELEGNPHIAKAGTIGNLMKSVSDDITSRMSKYGGGAVPTATASAAPAGLATSAKTPFDYSQFGSDEDEDLKVPETSDLGISPKKQAKAPEDDLEPLQAVANIAQQQAGMPPRPPQPQQGSLPALPSISSPQLGMKPEEILKAKPAGLAGALSPLMGTA